MLISPPRLGRSTLASTLTLLLLAAGCGDRDSQPLSPDEPVPVEPATDEDTRLDGPRTLDRRFLEFGERYPGFAGLFVNGTSLVIQVTAESSLPDVAVETVKDDLAAIIGRDRERLSAASIRYQTVEYDFETLDRWRNAVRGIDTGGRLLSLDVDERANRVRMGVSELVAESVIRSGLLELGIPDGAVIVEEQAPVVPGLSLRDRRRPVPGSMQIEYVDALGIRPCTLGFNAWLGDVRGFVTASHCSPTMAQLDSNDYWQNTGTTFGNLIGLEHKDPATHSCTMEGQPANCRHSDANFVRYNQTDTWDFPRMAISRTVLNTDILWYADVVCHSCGAPFDGDTIWRQGQRTGRKPGAVIATCVDKKNELVGIWIRCQDEVDARMGKGDSGGPVFTFVSGNSEEIWLHGIAWGFYPDCAGCDLGSPYVYSPMLFIEHELGMLVAEEGDGGGGPS